MPYYLLCTRGYGITINDIDWSNPAQLEPYVKAHKAELKEKDMLTYAVCGNYILSAVQVAVERCLFGRKAKGEYTQKIIMQELEKASIGITNEERKKQCELFVAKLETMKTNFELNHKNRGDKK